MKRELHEQQERCSGCGITKDHWKGNRGEGYLRDEEVYCCEGCARETDCTCLESLAPQREVRIRKTER